MDVARNRLYYGDNLDVLREEVASASIDLVYLDPPFNSNRNYNVIFSRHDTVDDPDKAQIRAFDDTWRWTPITERQFAGLVGGELPNEVGDALRAFRMLLGENDAMAYLVNMAPRMVELHRVLKPTGSLYLHADPTMSHYLKVLLDAIFGPDSFINDISWKRSSTRSSISKVYRRAHDCILLYAKTRSYTFNVMFRELSAASKAGYSKEDARGAYSSVPLLVSGRRNGDTGQPWRSIDPNTRGKAGMHWVTTRDNLDKYDREGLVLWPAKSGGLPRLKYYADEVRGVPLNDVWDDVKLISSQSTESLGFPTQKPVALLERIISASSNEGDVVLDPFCGCGTTVDAAQRLDRKWTGIDITYLAVDLIEKRLLHTFGDSVRGTYEVSGIPRDLGSAQALFSRSPFDFERWAVSMVGAQPNAKQVGDKGLDGIARFDVDNKGGTGEVVVSVKGGRHLEPSFVRDLRGTMERRSASMGLLITMAEPTRGVIDEINHGGNYTWPVNGSTFPRLQTVTVADLLDGKRPSTPPLRMPYIAASRHRAKVDQLSIDG